LQFQLPGHILVWYELLRYVLICIVIVEASTGVSALKIIQFISSSAYLTPEVRQAIS
jgi:hypothetical protein